MSKKKLAPGDIFIIANENLPHAIQIVDIFKGALYVCSYEIPADRQDNVSLVGARPIFGTLTLDALIYHGYWQKYGHSVDNLSEIKLPLYKVEFDGRTYIESFRGELLRPARPAEAEQLRYRTVVAPVRLDKAIKAFLGMQPWDLAYEDLKYEYSEQSSSLASS